MDRSKKRSIEGIISTEASLLQERVRDRISDVMFRSKKVYTVKSSREVISDSLNNIISAGVSAEELSDNYYNSTSFYNLVLVSGHYLFIRHTGGFSIVPLSEIKSIYFSEGKAFRTKYFTMTVSYENSRPDEFDFLFDDNTLRHADPHVTYDEFRRDFDYAVLRASRKAADVGGLLNNIQEDLSACEELFTEIAEKNYAFIREAAIPIKKNKQKILAFGMIAVAFLAGVMLYYDFHSYWFVLVIALFMLAEPWSDFVQVKLLLSMPFDVVLSDVKESIVSYSQHSGIECRELCNIYLTSEPVGNIALISGNWLILRKNTSLEFIDLNQVMGYCLKEERHEYGRSSYFRYYLMFRFFNGLVSFFEIGDRSQVVFSSLDDYVSIKRAIARLPWVTTSSDILSGFKSWEEFALNSATKMKAFYSSFS